MVDADGNPVMEAYTAVSDLDAKKRVHQSMSQELQREHCKQV